MHKNDSLPVNIELRAGAVEFTSGSQPIARLTSARGQLTALEQDGQPVLLPMLTTTAADATSNGQTIHYTDATWRVSDRIERLASGEFRCERTWHNQSVQTQEVVLRCELEHPGSDPFTLIPAVNYNGNQWGDGKEPKGYFDEASPAPNLWIFGGDRVSVPGCTISESDGFVVALYTTPEEAAHSGCALQPSEQGLRHGLWWPLQEQPRTYARRDTYAPGIYSTVRLAPGESCRRTFFVAIYPISASHHAYAPILDTAWKRFYHTVAPSYTNEQLWSLGVRFAKESLWVESDEFVGFSIGLQLRDGEWIKRPHWRYEIGWCGQNAGLAAMLLQDFLWHGDEDSWRRGAAALNFWATHGRLSSGLFYTHFDHKLEDNLNPDLDTCNLGHGAYQFLVAAELTEKAGRPQALWRETALSVCDFFTQNALPNGKLGRLWRGDGTLQQAEGTIGCSMVWPLAKAYRMTGNRAYLQTAERAYRAYADDDLAQLRCTAGALDTDCVDKETAFALLLPGVDLYEITGDGYYLQQAEKAAYYLASWQWHYNLCYPADSPATVMNYQTFGGTSVSAQHHHLDPWGALIALGWLRLAKASGKTIWQQRAAAAWRQAMIGVSDGTLSLKGVTRPVGGQDEGFYHTRWSGMPGYRPGDVSDWLVAWPSAFRLITLQQWADWAQLV